MVGNEAPIDIDWVKRLEFVSGPASAVYGANALYGIANAVMFEGGDINGTRLSVDSGSGRSHRLGLVAGQRIDAERDWFFGFSAYEAHGNDLYFREFDNGTSDGWARGLDGEQYQKAYGKLRWGDWHLIGNLSSRDKNIPTASYETAFGEPGTRTTDQHALVELNYDGRLPNGWQQQFRVFAGSYRYSGDYQYAGSLDNRDLGRANWFGSDYRLNITTLLNHKLTLGAEAQSNTQLAQKDFDLSPFSIYVDNNHPNRTFGVFAEDEWRFDPQWLLNLGLRYDNHSDFSAVPSPRVALIYQPSEEMNIKAMVGSAYRAPNAYERFYGDAVTQEANPTLQPERMRSVELAADFRVSQGGRFGARIYKNEVRDMIDQVVDPTNGLLVFTNQANVQGQGIELNAEGRWSNGTRLRGSISRQRSHLPGGAELANSPQLLGKLVFSVPLQSGWTAAGEWQGMSDRISAASRVPGFGVVNLMLTSARLVNFGEISLRFYNLGNRRYLDPAPSGFTQDALVQDGRQFRLRWTLDL